MKKYLFLIIFLSSILYSCNKNPEKILIGTWKLDSIQTNQIIPEDEIATFNKAKQEIKQSTFLTFNEDFSYKASIWGDTTNGFWAVDKNLILKISDASTGDTAETAIKDLSSQQIILEETSEGITSTLIFLKE